jgi:beta-galactosidase GanA
MSVNAQDAAREDNPLPKVWHILWSDKFTPAQLKELKSYGFDGVFKCVGGGEWRLVESVEGEYDWRALQACLDAAYQANMWFIPEVVINVPPAWFITRYPDSLLKDSRGITELNPNSEGAPYMLSPWFVASGLGDPYIELFIDEFMDLVSQYPNVPAVMLGNFKLNALPWTMGTGEDALDFTYWPLRDAYAIQSYQDTFGAGTLPPADWTAYQAMTVSEQEAFQDWLVQAMCDNLQNHFMPWLSKFDGYRVINVSIWNIDGVKESIFTTQTTTMTTAKQEAIVASGVGHVIINDDNMGDYGLTDVQQEDINLAHDNGFLIYGERVPYYNDWEKLYNMWAGFDPLPDGFINIEEETINPYWLEKIRTLYGEISKPLTAFFLPLIIR